MMTGRLKDLTMNLDGNQNITITVNADCRELFDKYKDVDVSVEIKKVSKFRSQDANNYLWHLCGEIAKASSKYSTDGKNEVYREAIRAKGEFEPLLVLDKGVDKFLRNWGEHGIGWFADIVDEIHSKDGKTYKVLHVYYGSSTYDSLEMSRIIDYVIMLASDLGIPTMTEKEKKKLLERWGKKIAKKVDAA